MEKNKGGRPEKIIDWDKLNAALQYGINLRDAAFFCDCSQDTLSVKIKENFGLSFPEYREKKMVKTRLTLLQKAHTIATSGNVTMLIFCLKNLCGWADKQETSIAEGKNVIQLKYALDKKPE